MIDPQLLSQIAEVLTKLKGLLVAFLIAGAVAIPFLQSEELTLGGVPLARLPNDVRLREALIN